MIILHKPEHIENLSKQDSRFMKYVCIGNVFVGVALEDLWQSMDFQRLPFANLELTDDFIASLPPPTSKIEHFDMTVLKEWPVLMFETPYDDGVYWRFDGRHRCLGAAENGYKQIPAKWVPRSLWLQFIIGYYTNDSRYGAKPFTWDRVPNLPDTDVDGCHYEPNFDIPEPDKFTSAQDYLVKIKREYIKRRSKIGTKPEPRASNAGMAMW